MRVIVVLSVLMVLVSCQKTGNDVVLKEGESAGKGNATLEVLDMRDSRCPKNCECFLAGTYEADLRLIVNDLAAEFTLREDGNLDTIVLGYEVVLKSITPDPGNHGYVKESERKGHFSFKKI